MFESPLGALKMNFKSVYAKKGLQPNIKSLYVRHKPVLNDQASDKVVTDVIAKHGLQGLEALEQAIIRYRRQTALRSSEPDAEEKPVKETAKTLQDVLKARAALINKESESHE
jgi:hypothetical protein